MLEMPFLDWTFYAPRRDRLMHKKSLRLWLQDCVLSSYTQIAFSLNSPGRALSAVPCMPDWKSGDPQILPRVRCKTPNHLSTFSSKRAWPGTWSNPSKSFGNSRLKIAAIIFWHKSLTLSTFFHDKRDFLWTKWVHSMSAEETSIPPLKDAIHPHPKADCSPHVRLRAL